MSNLDTSDASGDVWSRCVCTGGACLAYELSQEFGVTIAAEVLDFIANAESGTRLTLQRNQSGITTQIVSAVHRAEPGRVTFDDLFRFRQRLRGEDFAAVELSASPGRLEFPGREFEVGR